VSADELRRKAGELAREHSLDGTGVPYDDETLAILRAVAGGRVGLLKPAFAGKPERVTFQAGGDVLVIGGGDG
jgi:hypothetical protein